MDDQSLQELLQIIKLCSKKCGISRGHLTHVITAY